MDPLSHLPPELLLEVIAHLPLAALPVLRRASRGWNSLVAAHEDPIFRHVAQHELCVGPPCEAPDARHADWKAVCQCAVNRRLMKACKVASVDYYDFGEGFYPWRIKIDRERQWMFATTREGEGEEEDVDGLFVKDLRTKDTIQHVRDVKQYAHIEYDAGYLVATGPTGSTMTVYRTPSTEDSSREDAGSASPEAAASAAPPLTLHGTITSRGFRALRMHGTSLVTASNRRIEIFNVESLQLVQRLEIPPGLIDITYVEMDEEYVFVCALGQAEPPQALAAIPRSRPFVYIYRRKPRPDVDPYLSIPLDIRDRPVYKTITHQSMLSDPSTIDDDPRFQVEIRDAKRVVAAEVQPFELTSARHGEQVAPPFSPDVPVACHYGKAHLVILCRNGSILFVQDYKTTLSLGTEERHRKMFALTLASNGPDYWNLAVEGDLAYITSYQDRLFDPWAILIVIDLASLKPVSAPQDSAEIDIRSWDIPLPVQISSTHSLQATSEGVYMPVSVIPLRHDPGRGEEAGWVPPDYRREDPEKTCVISLRYSRH